MKDALFYDFDFKLLADFPRAVSFNITKSYCGFGTAELHFSLAETDMTALLEDNPYMFFTVGSSSAIVTGWRIGEDIAVFGRTPEWLLTKRGIEAFSKTGVTAETVAREAVESAAGDFAELGPVAAVGETLDYSTDGVRVLYDVVCDVLKERGLGFEVVPNTVLKKFVFRVYSGKEALCLLSTSSKTAFDTVYTVERQAMVTNSGWYEQRYTDMGKWDAIENLPKLSTGKSSNVYTFYEITSDSYDSDGDRVERFGLWCRSGYWLYCNQKDGAWSICDTKPSTVWVYIDNAEALGARRWDAVLSGTKTESEAVAELLQMTADEESSAEVKELSYGTDYGLGDIVRVQLEFGKFKKWGKKRVSSVSIYYDVDKSGVTPILGEWEE